MGDGNVTLDAVRRRGLRALTAVRTLTWRALGQPPTAAGGGQPPTTVGGQPRTTAEGQSTDGRTLQHGNPWRTLRRYGLRVEQGLRIYPVKGVQLKFEPPVQVNNTALDLYRNVAMGRYSYLRGGIVRYVSSIGRYTSIGPGVILGEAEHPVDWLSTSPAVFYAKRYQFYPPEADAVDRVVVRNDDNIDPSMRDNATIGNDVWIGANVMVRRGVTIGDGAIVGSGAFVNKDVRPYSIVGGLPAKEIGQRFADDVIQRLLALKWWEFDVSDLAGVDFSDVESAITTIEARESSGAIQRIVLRYSSVQLRKGGFHALILDPDDRARAKRRMSNDA